MERNTVLLAAVLGVTGALVSASLARAGDNTSRMTVKAAAKKQTAKAGEKAKDKEWRIYVSQAACGRGCTWREGSNDSAWSPKSSCSCPWQVAADSCKSLGGRLMTVKELLYTHKVECSSRQQMAETCGKCYWSSDLKTASYAWHVCFNLGDTPPRPDYIPVNSKVPVRCIAIREK